MHKKDEIYVLIFNTNYYSIDGEAIVNNTFSTSDFVYDTGIAGPNGV